MMTYFGKLNFGSIYGAQTQGISATKRGQGFPTSLERNAEV
jgi:hypothetical protein